MALNFMVKKSAVKKYGSVPHDQLQAAIAADEKGYSTEEINEIMEAITGGKAPEVEPVKPQPEPEPVEDKPASPFTMRSFEVWDVNVQFKKVQDEDFNVVTTHVFEKKGTKPLRTTYIEQRHADIINSQSANSKIRLYPKK